MTFHVIIQTPRAGLGFAVAPYAVEAKGVYASRPQAQAFADAKTLSAAVVALFDGMPPLHPAWVAGTIPAGVFYPLGAYRSHIGKTWQVRIGHTNNGDPNWAPGGAGNLWTLVETPGVTAWSPLGVPYAPGDQRTYAGNLYQCRPPGHTSQSDWMPSVTPALWTDLGSALEVPAYSRALWTVLESTHPDYLGLGRVKET